MQRENGFSAIILLFIVIVTLLSSFILYLLFNNKPIISGPAPIPALSTSLPGVFSPQPSSSASLSGKPNKLGTITGKICYPSEFLPKGQLVAKDLADNKLYTKNFLGSEGGAKAEYNFDLPEGKYYLRYEAHASSEDPSYFTSGYHTSCTGSEPSCSSSDKRVSFEVKVSGNQVIDNIDLCDFYYQEENEPEF